MTAFESIVNPPPIPQIPVQKPIDANFLDPNKIASELESVSLSVPPSATSTIPTTTPANSSDYGYGTDMRHRSSSSISYHSTHSTPHNFDSGLSYSQSVGSQYSYHHNNGNASTDGTWGPSNHNSNLGWDQNQSWVDSTRSEASKSDKSPVRESLDSRIELLLKQQSAGLAPSFLGIMSAMGSPPFVSNEFNTSSPKHNRKHELNVSSNKRQNHKSNDSDAILGTPPSPFLSASEFIKWHKLTKEIDSGKEPNLEDSDGDYNNNMDEEMPEDDSTPLKDEPHECKRIRSKSSKKGMEDDIDDDRMSLSSLSSGEKLHIGGDSEPSTSAGVLHPHPMYPSEQVQMMARLGLWKPGMGSDIGLSGLPVFSSTSTQPNFTSSAPAFAPFMYPMTGQSFNPQSGQPFSQPCFYPGYISSHFSSISAPMTPTSKVPQMSHSNTEWLKHTNEVNKTQITRNSLNIIVSELKELIKKDICKKMVENSAFKIFEKWWDDSERKSKTSAQDERFSTKPHIRSDSRQSGSDWHSVSTIFDNNRTESVNSFNDYGFSGLGLRAAIPKMPSFRRQLKKPPSPADDATNDTKVSGSDVEGDKISDVSDSESLRRRKSIHQKNRAAAVIEEDTKSSRSSESSSSSSSDSSSSDSSSSSGSDSDSDSSSSSSSSSSSVSSSSSSSDSSVSSKSSSSGNRKKKYRKHRSNEVKQINEKLSHSYDSDSSKSFAQRNVDLKTDIKNSEISTKSDKNLSQIQTNEQKPEKDSEITSQLEYEATQALMALATSFSSIQETNERSVRMNSDLTRNDKPLKSVPIGSDTESASESEQYSKDLPQTSVEFDHSYCLPDANNRRDQVSDLDSLIDSVARGVADNKEKSNQLTDHMYSRTNQTSTQVKAQKRSYKRRTSTTGQNKSPNQDFHHSLYAVASEWRKAKRKPTNITSVETEEVLSERSPSPPPQRVFKKRDLIEEMNILYEFLKTGIDSEDVSYLKRSYEAMLQEDNQTVWWLNDIHWVEHPPTHIASPKKKKKTDDSQARVHQTGCARSEGYYKMDIYEKLRLSHVSNTTANTSLNDDEDIPKQIRARQIGTQQSTREARSNQRRLLATVDAAWSDLLKFNQLQVSHNNLFLALKMLLIL